MELAEFHNNLIDNKEYWLQLDGCCVGLWRCTNYILDLSFGETFAMNICAMWWYYIIFSSPM